MAPASSLHVLQLDPKFNRGRLTYQHEPNNLDAETRSWCYSGKVRRRETLYTHCTDRQKVL